MEELTPITAHGKHDRYAQLYPQLKALVEGESDVIANMANIASALHVTFRFWWTGFYRVSGDELILGPFQGPVACSRIAYGRGVCGAAWREKQTQVVENVELFPGHIACSSASRSEIVVPVWRGGVIVGVLDIDSEHLATFDSTDKEWLEHIVSLLDN